LRLSESSRGRHDGLMKMKTILAVWLALLCTVHAEEKWKTYTNARFGFRLAHPSALVESRAPDNGGGQEFHSQDKEFSLAAFAHFVLEDQSLETMWKDELKELGDTVTYKKKGDAWFVVSGVKDGTEYYHKTYVQKRNYAAFQITYPHAKAKQYDPWVERIAKEFVPFLKGDYDREEK
jgi:hypothetical protein